MKYAQIFAIGTILAMLSLLVGGGCSTTGNGRLDIDAGAAIEAGYLTEESDPDFSAWLDTDPLGDLLSSYDEVDPLFTASAASGITESNLAAWSAAYGWGDHSAAGYLTEESDPDWNSEKWNYLRIRPSGSGTVQEQFELTESMLESFVQKFIATQNSTNSFTINVNSTNIIEFTNVIADSEGMYDSVNSQMHPLESNKMHRVLYGISFVFVKNGPIFLYMYENDLPYALISAFEAPAAGISHYMGGSFVFFPDSTNNYYDLRLVNKSAEAVVITNTPNNRSVFFGEKIQ